MEDFLTTFICIIIIIALLSIKFKQNAYNSGFKDGKEGKPRSIWGGDDYNKGYEDGLRQQR